ncbi:30S ribosome-binding factor RbfA [Candidatus Fermentibacterales bacterium]|nr:30S ribosome-binding factor RbfA [Candidatus Fermentibacterales bacterium]
MDERRRTRVAKAILREISLILRREARDPRLGGVVATQVRLSKDGSHCVVYYSVVSRDSAESDVRDALISATGFMRRLLADRLALRITPEISFVEDDSIEGGERVLRIMRSLEED